MACHHGEGVEENRQDGEYRLWAWVAEHPSQGEVEKKKDLRDGRNELDPRIHDRPWAWAV